MFADIVNIIFRPEPAGLTIVSDPPSGGTMYDNNAVRLRFVRDGKHFDDNLFLYFADKELRPFGPVNLGHDNFYVIPNSLTQTTELHLQCAFVNKEGTEVMRTNDMVLPIRLSPSNQVPPEQWPDPMMELYLKAVMAVTVDNVTGTLTLKNMAGDVIAKITPTRGPAGPAGEAGPAGPAGPSGGAGTIEISRVTYVKPEDPAQFAELPESTAEARKYELMLPNYSDMISAETQTRKAEDEKLAALMEDPSVKTIVLTMESLSNRTIYLSGWPTGKSLVHGTKIRFMINETIDLNTSISLVINELPNMGTIVALNDQELGPLVISTWIELIYTDLNIISTGSMSINSITSDVWCGAYSKTPSSHADISNRFGAASVSEGIQTYGHVRPSVSIPESNGTASVGDSLDYARADHKHPSEISVADREKWDSSATQKDLEALSEFDKLHSTTDAYRWRDAQDVEERVERLEEAMVSIEPDLNSITDIKNASEGSGFTVTSAQGGVVSCSAVNVVVAGLELVSGTLLINDVERWSSSGLVTIDLAATKTVRVAYGDVIKTSGMTSVTYTAYKSVTPDTPPEESIRYMSTIMSPVMSKEEAMPDQIIPIQLNAFPVLYVWFMWDGSPTSYPVPMLTSDLMAPPGILIRTGGMSTQDQTINIFEGTNVDTNLTFPDSDFASSPAAMYRSSVIDAMTGEEQEIKFYFILQDGYPQITTIVTKLN